MRKQDQFSECSLYSSTIECIHVSRHKDCNILSKIEKSKLTDLDLNTSHNTYVGRVDN